MQIAANVHREVQIIEVGMVVFGLATSHDENSKSAGTFTPPCCLVFACRDRQSWVPGPLPMSFRKHKSFTSIQTFHTHTHTPQSGAFWRHRPSLCVVGVVLGHIDLHFARQAWHLVTSTFTLRGRCGTWRHRPSLCVAIKALGGLFVTNHL